MFDPADLHLIADLWSDPLTRALRNNVFGFSSPVWSDDACRLLVLTGENRSDPLAVAIGKGALPFVETPDWSLGLPALKSVFALNRRLHLFRAEPSLTWVTFIEPQLTKGFAHFLNAPDLVVRTERVRALVKALGAADPGNDISRAIATAEAPTSGNKRIDLLIEWQDSSRQRFAVAIEAKLGHHITTGQLSAYKSHLRRIPKERRRLVVVSPRRNRPTDRSLRHNQDWRWVAWRDLLVAHERCLHDHYDEPAFLQFRRTLWDQTG